MKFCDINIRDPFILLHEGKYYMYGTRAKFTWGDGTKYNYGFDVYESDDLESWSEPKEIFSYYDGFYGIKDFWAPEVHYYEGKFYMLATFKVNEGKKGTAILVCDTPNGTFKVHSNGPVTPSEWECLDGTLYIENGTPYMIFCHEWTQIGNGAVCAVELTKDLKAPVGTPRDLFFAGDASWRHDINGNGAYVTDGPFIISKNGKLSLIWSSFYKGEYCQAVAHSDNGKISGNWTIDDKLIYEKDGGHGMIFTDKNGNDLFVFHTPNETPNERPCVRNIDINAIQE